MDAVHIFGANSVQLDIGTIVKFKGLKGDMLHYNDMLGKIIELVPDKKAIEDAMA